MQGLTTKAPADSIIEAAIASVEAVFDWRAYQTEQGIAKWKKKNTNNEKHGKKHKNRVHTTQEQEAVITPGAEEEEDEILRALDRFFEYDGERTVVEMGEPTSTAKTVEHVETGESKQTEP